MWHCQEVSATGAAVFKRSPLTLSLPLPLQTHRISGDNRGWVDEYSVPSFSSNVSTYIAISPLRDGPSGHYKHLVHVHIHRKQILPLTHGKFEVNRIVSWDQQRDWVYFLGVPEGHPSQQHLYRVLSTPPKFGIALKQPQCLTCAPQPAVSGLQASVSRDSSTQAPVKIGTKWDDGWEGAPPSVTVPTHPSTTSAPTASSSTSSFRRKRPNGEN